MIFNGSHISYTYPGASKPALNRVTFELRQPGLHALFGPSGVGKTSLARILSGAVTQYDGTLQIPAKDQILYTHNQEELPGWSDINRHFERVTPEGLHDTAAALTNCFGTAAVMGSRFSQLSLGQKNRVNLIRYLVQPFQLLIMDESLANVDEKMRREILFEIKARFPDRFFLYISHNLMEVATFCRDIWVLRDPDKTPQLNRVTGLDLKKDQPLESSSLDKILLKVMNHAA